MNKVVLFCWASMTAMFLGAPVASAHPVTGSPSGLALQALQDLLKRLEEKFDRAELAVPEEREGDAEADSSDPDLADSEALLRGPLEPVAQLSEAEVEEQWRKFFAAPKRRRYFSGCFGTRLERIGTQTGLGCNIYTGRSWKKNRS